MIETDQKIKPEKVTKPIQLLAAWLIGLIVVNGSFLTTASILEQGSWEKSLLVIASVVNVPLFLAAMFLLQTKFRPELQEDLFYSQYLDKRTNTVVAVAKDDKIESELIFIKNQLLSLQSSSMPKSNEEEKERSLNKTLLGTTWRISINYTLDNFREINKRLRENDISVTNTFGSPNNVKPDQKVLALSRRVDFKSKVQIILLAWEWGFKVYEYYDAVDEEVIKEEILIGSYGTGEIPITDELIDLLKSDPNWLDFVYFEKNAQNKTIETWLQ